MVAQKLDQMNTQFVQTQNQVMSRLTTLEGNQSSPRHPFVRKEPTGWKANPQKEVKAPNTLNPIRMVNLEELPWCSLFQDLTQRKSVQDEKKSFMTVSISWIQYFPFRMRIMIDPQVLHRSRLTKPEEKEPEKVSPECLIS